MKGQRGFVRTIVSIVLLLIAVWVFLNRQFVFDQLVVWQYRPTAPVEQVAARAQFSDAGKFLFYASQPDLSNQASFNQHCKSQEEESVILGCYSAQRIYVYNVTDARLDGVKEVTAAHEMLHAAYERLSKEERQKIDSLLEAEMTHNTNKRLKERLKIYERTEPGQRDNELHSILGTETAKLSSELEAYYKKYFTKRSAVVALFNKYEAIFRDLEDQQTRLVSQLEAMAKELKQRTSVYNAGITSLNNDIEVFNQKADTEGGFNSQGEFIAARAALLSRQAALETERTSLRARIAQYNAKRKVLESLNLRAKELHNSLDSTPAPVPAL